jgi:hypothetical protein
MRRQLVLLVVREMGENDLSPANKILTSSRSSTRKAESEV